MQGLSTQLLYMHLRNPRYIYKMSFSILSPEFRHMFSPNCCNMISDRFRRQTLMLVSCIIFATMIFLGRFQPRISSSSYRVKTMKKSEPQWLVHSNKMSYLQEDILRCSAKDFGRFSLLGELRSVLDNVGRNKCLEKCIERGAVYAGITTSKKCYCMPSLLNAVASSQKTTADSIDMAATQDSDHQIRIFKILKGCFRGFSNELLGKALLGCVPIPVKLSGSMSSWTIKNMTTAQCILHCETHHYKAAMPVKAFGTCICSDLLSVFISAENMPASADACADTEARNNDKLLEVYATFAESQDCEPVRFLKPHQGEMTLLYSSPGSGNTWIRHLLEAATGIYTGSAYGDRRLYGGGLIGEREPAGSRRTIAIKNHMLHYVRVGDVYTSALVVVRNLYNSVLGDFARKKSKSHTGLISPLMYKSPEFKAFVLDRAKAWYENPKKVFDDVSPVLVVYYEDLVSDPVGQLRRIVTFLPTAHISEEGVDLERRLMCMNLDLMGDFKRPPWSLDFDPFDAELRRYVDGQIRKLDELMEKYGHPRLPVSYYEK